MRYYLKKAVLVMSLLLLLGVVLLPAGPVAAASQVSLFTKFTGFAVSPGESINYSISAINDSNVIQRVTLELIEQPEGWDSKLTAGGWRVSQISVKPKGDEIFYLETQVPLQIEKGKYTFRIRATDNSGGTYVLPIVMEVTEEGTFKTELETDQPSMQGDADSTFNFSLTLRNRTAEEQLYALSAGAPRGWSVSFESQGQKVASVKVDANGTQNISVRINPPAEIEAGKYTIPVKAQAGSFEAEINLEVDIVGTYKLTLSTPTGVLSTSATIGREKLVELQLGNNGSSELNDIVMNHSSPIDWEVRFEPETV
ncbi:MAG TPA: hypothetical protein GX697_04755, partial [Firmicutes bacterium]|nr:hypothetical protein [Bacillota bacterium]